MIDFKLKTTFHILLATYLTCVVVALAYYRCELPVDWTLIRLLFGYSFFSHYPYSFSNTKSTRATGMGTIMISSHTRRFDPLNFPAIFTSYFYWLFSPGHCLTSPRAKTRGAPTLFRAINFSTNYAGLFLDNYLPNAIALLRTIFTLFRWECFKRISADRTNVYHTWIVTGYV